MNKIKQSLIEDLYWDWTLAEEENTEEKRIMEQITKSTPIPLEVKDLINEYGVINERQGFVAGFDTAIKLLIGAPCGDYKVGDKS